MQIKQQKKKEEEEASYLWFEYDDVPLVLDDIILIVLFNSG